MFSLCLCYNILMDNKAYLDQIAVKGKVKSGPIFTPMLIKLIAAGAIILITMIIVGSIISGSNAKVTQSFERVYVRISNFGSDDYENPLQKYADSIRNSDLRTYCEQLRTIMYDTNTRLSSVISSTGVKTDKISKDITSDESLNWSNYIYALDNALLSGTLDRTFATETEYQLSTLIQYEHEALNKSNNQEFSNILQQSIKDLTSLQQNFKSWADSH